MMVVGVKMPGNGGRIQSDFAELSFLVDLVFKKDCAKLIRHVN